MSNSETGDSMHGGSYLTNGAPKKHSSGSATENEGAQQGQKPTPSQPTIVVEESGSQEGVVSATTIVREDVGDQSLAINEVGNTNEQSLTETVDPNGQLEIAEETDKAVPLTSGDTMDGGHADEMGEEEVWRDFPNKEEQEFLRQTGVFTEAQLAYVVAQRDAGMAVKPIVIDLIDGLKPADEGPPPKKRSPHPDVGDGAEPLGAPHDNLHIEDTLPTPAQMRAVSGWPQSEQTKGGAPKGCKPGAGGDGIPVNGGASEDRVTLQLRGVDEGGEAVRQRRQDLMKEIGADEGADQVAARQRQLLTQPGDLVSYAQPPRYEVVVSAGGGNSFAVLRGSAFGYVAQVLRVHNSVRHLPPGTELLVREMQLTHEREPFNNATGMLLQQGEMTQGNCLSIPGPLVLFSMQVAGGVVYGGPRSTGREGLVVRFDARSASAHHPLATGPQQRLYTTQHVGAYPPDDVRVGEQLLALAVQMTPTGVVSYQAGYCALSRDAASRPPLGFPAGPFTTATRLNPRPWWVFAWSKELAPLEELQTRVKKFGPPIDAGKKSYAEGSGTLDIGGGCRPSTSSSRY